MDTRILLNNEISKQSVNTSESINVKFKGNRKLLPLNDYYSTISQDEQYTKERNGCNKIRLTCQINPICSNVLFNKITEIVKDEGTSSATVLNYKSDLVADGVVGKPDNFKWNKTEAIKDMQLSKLGWVYHCGSDVFNNHLIRSKTFKTFCKGAIGSNSFNTISGAMVTASGEQVIEDLTFPVSAKYKDNKDKVNLHLYEIDDILTYYDALETKLIENHDGWFGFENTSKIKTYSDFKENDSAMNIERPISYMNGGDFIDMYPSRDLYSFIPKYNKHAKRIEKNWNYCLTYPSSSTTDGFDFIETTNGINSLKAVMYDETTRMDNGSKQLVVYSMTKHGLQSGDIVNVYITDNGENIKVLDNAEVINVADEYVFTVSNGSTVISSDWITLTEDEDEKRVINRKKDDLGRSISGSINDNIASISINSGATIDFFITSSNSINLDVTKMHLSFKKVVGDIECSYYVRIFSKIPNFKFASGDTLNEYEIYKDDASLIKQYQSNEYEFENSISRLSFAKNVYGDGIGQLVFTDDINIDNLKDNLGRPLSSIYLTIIKNNKGYKEWYGFNGVNVNTSADTIEYSHCFGGVTCGFEMSERTLSQNIFSMKNTYGKDSNNSYGLDVECINGIRETVNENEVSYYDDKNYYGDLCCYDSFNAIERVIQPTMFRFNTAQRESIYSTKSNVFDSYKYDEILYDDYDIVNKYQVDEKTISDCNSLHEGYYYNPHYEIKIKTFDKLRTAMPDFLTMLSFSAHGSTVTISTMERHYLTLGDKSMLFDIANNKYYTLVRINEVSSNDRKFTANVFDEFGNKVTLPNDLNFRQCRLFKIDNLEIPSYAKVLKDGTCRLIWRDILNNGFNISDSTVEEYPFTNGAFYINKKIDIYVKRQDLYGYWGLHDDRLDEYGLELEIENEDYYVKEKDIVC